MSPDIVKSLIRKGQSTTVFFVERPDSPTEIISYINLILEAKEGHLIIGVKECGTVVGLRKAEAQLHQIAKEATLNTPLKVHIVQLITEFKVIVISFD